MNRVKIAKVLYAAGTGMSLTAKYVARDNFPVQVGLYVGAAGSYACGAKLLCDEMSDRLNKYFKRDKEEDIIDVEWKIVESA